MNIKQQIKVQKGITLLALIVVIIILIILAGLTITLLLGDNGLISKAQNAGIETKKSAYIEEINLIIIESRIDTSTNNETSLINIVENKLKEKKWLKDIFMYDQNNNIVEKDGVKLIIKTKDNFEIEIVFNNEDVSITYICYKKNNDDKDNNMITITYLGNGGKLSDFAESMTVEVRENSTIILIPNSFTNTMYDFISWTDSNGNEYQVGEQYQVNNTDITFSAKWEYKIKEELSCLITTGNQYIDTGYLPNQDTSIEIQCQILSRKSQFIYGSRIGLGNHTYSFNYSDDSVVTGEGFRDDYGNEQIRVSQEYEGIQTIKKEKNKVYINGILKYTHSYSTFSTSSSSKNNTLFLFNVNTNGVVDNSVCAKLKFYYCKIWDGDILVRDFIPVMDNNGVICILDKIENKLYYAQYGNANEEFEQETDIIELSSAICDGNQYIDTGVKANQDTTIEMKFKLNSSANQALFGARTAYLSKTFTCFFASTGTIRFDYNTIQTPYNGYTSGTLYIIKQAKNNFYINGSLKGSTSYSSFNGDYNLYLFAVNTSGTAELKAYIDFCYCKIWDNTTLVRDYVPVLDTNNIVCLYDKIEQKYYYGIGSNLLLGRQ